MNNRIAQFALTTELIDETAWLVAGFMRGFVVLRADQIFERDPKKIIPAANIDAQPQMTKPTSIVYIAWHSKLPDVPAAELAAKGPPVITCKCESRDDARLVDYEWLGADGKILWGGTLPFPLQAVW